MTASSSSFVPQQVTHVAAAGVRVRFSTEPKLGGGTDSDDALTPGNYQFTGPVTVIPARVVAVSNDPLSVDVFTNAPLTPGSWTVTVAATVRSDEDVLVSTPRTVAFVTAVTVSLDVVSGGATTDTAADIIRRHLPRSFVGRAWDAIIAALATGDRFNADNAIAAFNQLFLASASGAYLERRAGEAGVSKPVGLGMGDTDFRQFAIKSSSGRVATHSLWEILEVFYGTESVRAYLDSGLSAPFALEDGQALKVYDGRDELEIIFSEDDFMNIAAAGAAEVTAVIVRQARAADLKVFAEVLTDPLTTAERVRLYSSALGLGANVMVTGGLAQNGLKFPTLLLNAPAAFTAPTITAIADQALITGVSYSMTPTVTNPEGFTLAWSVVSGTLPAGLSINASTGEISGTPSATETVNIKLRITYVYGASDSNVFEMDVVAPFSESFEVADAW